jgi:hypothetical protein
LTHRKRESNKQSNDMDIETIIKKHAAWLRSEEGGERANLTLANLTLANLKGAGANLTLANLKGANLKGANLTGANLTGADLTWANLKGANLNGANLNGANLNGANLNDAYLPDAYLTDANLTGAKNVYQFGPMPTSRRICVAVWHETKWMVKAGCFWGTLEELEKKVNEQHKCPVYLANIALLRAWKIENAKA